VVGIMGWAQMARLSSKIIVFGLCSLILEKYLFCSKIELLFFGGAHDVASTN